MANMQSIFGQLIGTKIQDCIVPEVDSPYRVNKSALRAVKHVRAYQVRMNHSVIKRCHMHVYVRNTGVFYLRANSFSSVGLSESIKCMCMQWSAQNSLDSMIQRLCRKPARCFPLFQVGLFLWTMNMYNPYEWGGRHVIGLTDSHHGEMFNLPGSLWFVFTSLQWQGQAAEAGSRTSRVPNCSTLFACIAVCFSKIAAIQ